MKRVMDVCASLAALIVLSPVFLLVAIVVYVNAPGPVIYGHLRIGRINKPFRM
ncbi:TPA: sugar transferase [Enterococcus faecium]|nr:sugar transferase [Enterococcus faecium]HBM5893195.1 sugar transferase [Enterococcus faecium]HBM5895964.1 sugar transferase [Enterococcus faecium]HBM7038170.1 sugar transferase [Enterococcus faecium]HCR2890532.1 sugar transferase [Enterococcus faecium]